MKNQYLTCRLQRSYVIIILTLCIFSFSYGQDRDILFKRAYKNFTVNRYEACLPDLNEILRVDSSDYAASYIRGIIYYSLGKNKEALSDFQNVTEYKGNYEHVYYFIGMLYGYNNKYDDAIFSMSKEIEAHPDLAEAYFRRGCFYLQGYTYEIDMQNNAIGDFNKAISLDSTKSEYYYELGLSQKFSKRRQEAIATFNKAIKLNPYVFSYYDERNTCHELITTSYLVRKKDLYQGINNFKKYDDRSEPGMKYYYIGRCFKLMYDFSKNKTEVDSSMFYYDKALTVDSTNAEVYLEKGRIYRDVYKNKAKACAEFKKAVTYNPKHSEMWLNYAWALEGLGKKQEAHNAYSVALGLHPEDFRAKDGLNRTR